MLRYFNYLFACRTKFERHTVKKKKKMKGSYKCVKLIDCVQRDFLLKIVQTSELIWYRR